ncbi:MAG: hypothetical protein PVJ02_02275 [Gemmatimonadota bacterium]
MTCGFCGKTFEEDRSQPACAHCPVGSSCGLVRCPHCGYENPATPGWVAFLKRTFGRKDPSPPPSEATVRGRALPVIAPRP